MNKLVSTPNLEKLAALLWGLLLISLPVTSFRYFPSFLGRTTIQPLSLYPLALLIPVQLWLMLRERKFMLPRAAVPLAAFGLFALLVTAVGSFYAPLALRGASYWDRAIRGWFSLGFGVLFFFSAYWASLRSENLRPTLKWLYAGLIACIFWGGLQAVANHTPLLNLETLSEVQLLFSTRRLLTWRISGFALEPSWFADQLVLLFIPWLFAALLSRFRLTRHAWLEPLLLLSAVGLLLLTFSRSGILSAVMVTGVVLVLTGRKTLARIWAWLTQPFKAREGHGILLRIVVIFVIIAAIVGAFAWLSQYRYFSRLWSLDIFGREFSNYLVSINAGPRAAAAIAGYEVYALHPWTGVGLGGSSLYLFDHYPDWILTFSMEINRALAPDSLTIPNIRNLYVRLLAETGLPGFWLFIAFQLAALGSLRGLLRASDQTRRMIGIAGLFFWLAVFVRNFTQDSFTFPLMWVGLGIFLGQAEKSENSK